MAYNNPFPMTYPSYPQYAMPMPQPQVQPQTSPVSASQQSQNSNLIWVQGEAGAKSYLVAPNTTVQLWDSEAQSIYLKSADASGMPSMKILDYTIRGSESPETHSRILDDPEYATKEDFYSLKDQVEDLRRQLKSFSHPKSHNKKEIIPNDEQ